MGAAEVWNAFAACASAGAAFLALRVAVQSRKTAETVAQIERDRLHHELTPQFDVGLFRLNEGGPVATLRITWEGPSTLERLSEVRVFVRDQGGPRTPATGGPPTAEQIAAIVWSPYRLRPGVSGASSDGRTATHHGLELGGQVVLTMEPTMAPAWVRADDWFPTGLDRVQLRVEAVHPDYRLWIQVFEVPVDFSFYS
ncbi:hypothetical protein AB0O57_29055 [Streptomyces sp. NPDC091201]|uniref:hypothetical protein n=1 Tax=Streptomyces sp. NPDC091201 TaxID=3155190 RepID=UPI003432B4AD